LNSGNALTDTSFEWKKRFSLFPCFSSASYLGWHSKASFDFSLYR